MFYIIQLLLIKSRELKCKSHRSPSDVFTHMKETSTVSLMVFVDLFFQMVTHYIGHIIPEQAGHAG